MANALNVNDVGSSSSSGGGAITGPLDRKADADSVSVALSTENAALIGALTETAPATDTASSGINGRLQRVAQRLTSLIALVPATLGSKSAATSFSVTQSTEDAAQLGSLTETAPATDTASSGLNGRLQRVAQRLTSLIALFPTALGTATAANSLPVALSSDGTFATLAGGVTETAPATDTASSGLNGRLQRIAQRLSTLITAVGTLAYGAGTSTAAARVTTASDDPLNALLTTIRSPGLAASAAFTPANTSHTAGDCNGAATQFSFGAVSASNIMITGASILINTGTAQATAWRLHLYNVTPPSALADDAAWDLATGDQASYLGYVDLYTAIDQGANTQYNLVTGLSIPLKLSGTSVFGYLVNGTTLTTLAVTHTVTLNAIQL